MEHLATLRDLQCTLDYLRTIDRDLSALPSDLAALESRLKTIEKQTADKTKALDSARTQIQAKSKELAQALKDEERARVAVKATSQKVHYASAIRELDEKERLRTQIARPLKIQETEALALDQALAALAAEHLTLKAQFDELHAIFLDEHANQVEGRKVLKAKQAELEAKLPAPEVARFHRLAAARQGRVVVPVENGACSGCHVKLRGPFLFQIKEAKGAVACESCLRILYLP
jgi:predicted  nucleic acid-binding Zn-ribbon protein